MEKVTAQQLGEERFKSDKRQLGGLMMLSGASVLIFPMAKLATLVGPDGSTPSSGIPLAGLIASVCVITMGVMSIPTGYLQAVHDVGDRKLTGFLILFGQLAWLPFLTDMTDVGLGAKSGSAFIPEAYGPSPGDVRFVGAMGILGILGYGTGFLGTLSFLQFSLYAFQSNKPGERPGAYYQGRLSFYSFCNFLVGLSNLLLGCYILAQFGGGPLPNGPIGVAMYMVNFPELNIVTGLIQLLNSLIGFSRSCGVHRGEHDHLLQISTLVQWVSTVVLQILAQVAYNPGGAAAAAVPSQTMLTIGINIIVPYLDYKMRTTPDELPPNYYGLDSMENDSDEINSPTFPAKEEQDENEGEDETV